jgi:class 3 adenylate cyclase
LHNNSSLNWLTGGHGIYDGYIVQSTGDGIFALFGAPVAHEDHPQRALYAALRMQDDIRRFAERLRAEKGMNLQVRVGANVGEVVVRSIQTGERHAEYTPIGHSTSLASRLQALANPGSIAICLTSIILADRIDSRFLLPGLRLLPHVNCYPAAELRGGGGDGEALEHGNPA